MHLRIAALVLSAIVMALLGSSGAEAQSGQARKRPSISGPFDSDWAKPYPQTGGYFYDDPRTRPQRGQGPSINPTCPIGTTYVPSIRSCR